MFAEKIVFSKKLAQSLKIFYKNATFSNPKMHKTKTMSNYLCCQGNNSADLG